VKSSKQPAVGGKQLALAASFEFRISNFQQALSWRSCLGAKKAGSHFLERGLVGTNPGLGSQVPRLQGFATNRAVQRGFAGIDLFR
jgi:hypothetical protein